MKTNLLLAALLLFICGNINAQTTADVSGIGIQGIARDANNTARTSEALILELTFYYKNANDQEVEIMKMIKSVSTDAFGVFSTVAETNIAHNPAFANTEVFLRISDSNTVISDEKLKSVAYSYSAANGVPTGSIMPFMGTEVPDGWVLCDGRSLASIPGSSFLQTILGSSSVPDLGGMFLRGTGSNNFTNKNTTLGERQDDTYLSHAHSLGTAGGTSNTGNHRHVATGNNYDPNRNDERVYDRLMAFQGIPTGGAYQTIGPTDTRIEATSTQGRVDEEPVLRHSVPMPSAGNHTHSLTGNTNASGDTNETRPTSYGVNYIIKL